MTFDIMRVGDVRDLSDADFGEALAEVLRLQRQDRQEHQLEYYEPTQPGSLRVLGSDARIIGVGGGNRCQPAGTRVHTGRGMLCIEDVAVGDVVPGRHRFPGRVEAIYRSPRAVPVYKVTTKRGYTMQGSGEHKNMVAVAQPAGWHNAIDPDYSTRDWATLASLAGIDFEKSPTFIAMSAGGGFAQQCDISADDAYFFGLMAGDGCYSSKGSRRNVMNYTTNDNDFELIAWMQNYLAEKGVSVRTAHKKQTNGTTLSWCNGKLREWADACGLKPVTGAQKDIPESVWRGTKDVVAAFIRGFADSDGCATLKPSVVLVNISECLMRGTHILLRQFGIRSSLRLVAANEEQKRPTASWRLEITGSNLRRYAKEIGFLSPQKAARLPVTPPGKKINSHIRWDRIKSLERVKDRIVYGLTVSPKPHYHADGFLQHNSSKTTTCMVRWVSLATGIIPRSVWGELRPKFKGPLRVRVVVESITNTLTPVILPKLRYNVWSGLHPAGGDRGHWGWIPRMCLIDGDWGASWSEKYRTLRLLCRDPDDPKRILGESTVQFNSFDQDPADFASGDFDIVHQDEPPPLAIHVENEARTMSVGGMMMLSMTWPDDPAINSDWIYDRVYEPGLPGPNRNPDVEWIELDTTLNRHLDQESIAKQAAAWDDVTRAVRIRGQPLRFSNRIHPLFTDIWQVWSFAAGAAVGGEADGIDSVPYCHVQYTDEGERSRNWPVICLIDPHPRKPHCLMWARITPADDVEIVAELQIDGDPAEVKLACDVLEDQYALNVCRRMGDPNMLASPSGAMRNVEWVDEFAAAGLAFELADKSDVGRTRVNEYLRPDHFTRRPRLVFHPRCVMAIQQMKRFVWDEYRRKEGRDVKQTPRKTNDDYPALLRYLMNSEPEFNALAAGPVIIQTRNLGGRGRYV